MATIGRNTYYQNGSTAETGVGTPAHLISAYLASKGLTTKDEQASFWAKYGLSGQANDFWSVINKDSTLSKRILSDIGLGTSAQQSAFKQILSTPASGVTAEMRAANPDAAAARYAALEGGTTYTGGSSTTGAGGMTTEELNAILNNPNLTPDMKAAIQSVYNATVEGDADKAARIAKAMSAASEFSSPYFKAQIRLATDALQRGLSAKEGDLSFAEQQQRSALEELQANTAASKDQLSFQHAQELQGLARKYETDLSTTQDNLASAGFTSSSKRSRAESLLAEQNQGLVESSNKQFNYQTGNLDRSLSYQQQNTQAQIENLRRLAEEGKLDLLRQTEQSVGSTNLSGYNNLLGNIGGEIPRAQAQDQLSFASNFVF